MNRDTKKAFVWILLLTACAMLMVSCIHPAPGDFYTTAPDTTLTPPESTPTTPEETTPEATTPEATTPQSPTPEETTPEQTTPEQTTPEQTTPEETTPEPTTPSETTTEPPTVPPEPVEKIKIYIDQGHNPSPWKNTGAEGNGLYEQDLTYEIGILLAELLKEDERFEIRLSRPTPETYLGTGTDNDSSLDARVNEAEDWKADYFISLHINSSSSSSATGIEAYHANNDIAGQEWGKVLLDGLEKATGLESRGIKTEDYRVLKNTTMPATLIEMGFISNPSDAAMLDKTPELFAQGIYNGIITYFASIEG